MATSIKQYLRKWSMMINGEPFIDPSDGHQFRCVFDIEVSPGTLSMADIQIFNLSKATAIDRRSDIIFSAGYQDNFDPLFSGTVTNVFKERRGPDVITRLLCRSGIARERGLMSSSYGPGSRLTDVLVDAARTWPLYLEIDLTQFDDKDVFPSGYTASGDVKAVLDGLAYMFGFQWSPERGSLVVTRIDRGRTTAAFEINQHTGMVGMPEVNRGPQGLGVDVTTRINPFIRTSSRINVKSEYSTYNTGNMQISETAGDVSANGEYNVLRLKYVGDSHGDAWDMRIEAIRAQTQEAPSPVTGAVPISGGGLVWGSRVSPEFRAKVRQVSDNLNLDPNWLMAVMAFETGKTFNPAERNKAGSGATGLIQFMPKTAAGMGTSTRALANMSAVEQLDWVEKYYRPYKSRIKNIGDAYMAVFMPEKGLGRPDDFVLIDRDTQPITYRQNAGLDKSHDGTITRGEAVSRVNEMFKEGEEHKA